MKSANTHPSISDPERLEALRSLSLLDTPPEPSFDRLTKLTAKYMRAPVALVSLVDTGRQFFKSCCGLPEPWASERETPLSHSFCKHVVTSGAVLAIEDARVHPLVKNNDAVRDLGVIAYLGVPLLSADGQVLGALCAIDGQPRRWSADDIDTLQALAESVMTEITLRADLQARERAEEKAEAANRAKDAFLASLSHELRTPLAPVLLSVSDLEADQAFPENYREEIRMIRRNVEMEARLIDDLLDLTRITHGKLELRLTISDLHTLVHLAAGISRHEITRKKLTLLLSLEARRCAVRGDEARLQQVIWNLLKNAVKFTPPGGIITITTRDLPGDRLELLVADTGIGIAPEDQPRIFDAFEQGGVAGHRQFGGLGLGLAISRSLVTAHEGTLTARSEGLGTGSRFALELPGACEPDTADFKPSQASAAGPDGAGVRVLLVEDHEDSAMVLRRMLVRDGFVVSRAANCATASQLAADGSFDLLISDIDLPDGSGLDLVRKLRLPAIALTGYGTEEDHRKASLAGFSVCLVKPINYAQLRATIGNVSARP